ncbi:MAG: rhodanese-like domain-containing protein [Ardenticatenia bacterium]|nr:rhodanese-like domain-containing protein [Ardenticatenia bacterium]
MKKLVESMIVLLALASLVGVVASCGSAATAVPTAVPTAPPAASPTSAEVAVANPEPTPVPTEEPPAVPTPEPKGTSSPADQVPRISVEELKALMDSGAPVLILDVRPRESFQMGHIKGAILFSWKPGLTFDDVDELGCCPPIVTYCDCGPGEFDSADVARQLIELGYGGDVKVLAHPAIEGWIELGYPTQ